MARMGDRRGAYNFFMGGHDGKGPLGRPRCRWQNNIKVNLTEIGWEGVQVTGVAEGRGKGREFCDRDDELSGYIQCRKFIA